jgi:hypothetical protein
MSLTKHHAMKTYPLLKYHDLETYWGSGSIAPRILDGGEWSASRPGRFTSGEELPVGLDGRLGGSQSRSVRGCEEKKIPIRAGNRIPVFQSLT